VTDTIAAPAPTQEHLDPGRWVTLAIVIVAAFIVVLDNTVLNVAIPTILHEFHTTLPSLEWVVTGYALTFATLLIIGGRLGDIYGHRRIFIIGAALFGVGSLIASISTGVPELILGEAIIEGIGASLMLPATLAILSGTFSGRERATAFAAWGATAGVAVACGPVVGGFLTEEYSWRWAFRINVIVAPLAMLGAIIFMKHAGGGSDNGTRQRIDLRGAFLVASGMFLLVFALSEGGIYGWFTPIKDFSVMGHVLWPASRTVSVIPIIFVIAATLLATFYFWERHLERRGGYPLFVFAHFRFKTYRYGLITGLVLSMGQLGLSFVLPIFLQDGKHLNPLQNGWWQLPTGIFVILGAQAGGRLINRFGVTTVVRFGLISYALGVAWILHAVSLSITEWTLLPGLALYGVGVGLALAQLTNVVLTEIPNDSAGVASGANTTTRQVGAALGVAVIGSMLTVRILSETVSRLKAAALPADVKQQALQGVHALGAGYQLPPSAGAQNGATVQHALATGVAAGTRFALMFALVVIIIGALLSWLIPKIPPAAETHPLQGVEGFEPALPLDPDPELIEGDEAPAPRARAGVIPH
jgi:EmrB/QacA subfamily drug resistance transporter